MNAGDDAIARWERATEGILARLRQPNIDWDDLSTCGEWTNRELLVHIATGYVVRIEALEALLANRAPNHIDADHANTENQARWRSKPTAEIIDELVRVRKHVATLLHLVRPDQLTQQVVLGDNSVVLATALVEFSQHDLEHLAQITGA